MKKSISLFFVMLLCCSFAANSQIKFGIKGGLNVTKMSFSDVPSNFDSNNRLGFFVGPILDVRLPLVGLGVDAAFLFSNRQGRVKTSQEDKTFSESGFDIPINLKYSFGLSRLAAIYFAAGPNFFFNIDKNQKVGDYKFDKKSAQVGINVGGGINFLKHYQIGVNYNIPLNKSAEDKISAEDVKQAYDASYKTKTWQMSFAYFF